MIECEQYWDNGIAWQMLGGHLDRVKKDILPLLTNRDDADIVKENPVRTAVRHKGLFLKIYRVKKLSDKLRYLAVSSKARTEWDMSSALAEAHIPSVKPVALGERKKGGFLDECYFIAVDLRDAVALKEKVAASSGQDRLRLAEKAAELAHKLHEGSFFHRDLHDGNVLVGDDGRLYVIDLHRMSRGIGEIGKTVNLAFLFGPDGRSFDKEEALHGVKRYCELAGRDDPEAFFARTSATAAQIHERHLASRSLRCVKESSRYTIDHSGPVRIYRKKILSFDDVIKIVEGHERQKREGSTIHDSKRSIATRIECDWMENRPAVFVKEEKPRGTGSALAAVFRGSRTRKAWLASCAFETREVSSPEALAFAEVSLSGPGNLIITRFLDGTVSLEDAAEKSSVDDRKAVIGFLGKTAGRIHGARIYHSDWSTKNFLVSVAERKAFVIDAEAVDMSAKLTRDRVVKNLGQLNDIEGVTKTDRLRFYKAYHAAGGAELSRFAMQRVTEYTRGRVEAREAKLS